MNLPNRRRLGAIALIVAGIGAFLVPFLLHAPTPQGTSTNNNNNNNGGGGTTPTTSDHGACTTNCSPPGGSPSGTSDSGNCGEDAKDVDNTQVRHQGSQKENKVDDQSDHQSRNQASERHEHNGQHGLDSIGDSLKHELSNSVAFMTAMGSHTPAFHATHSTDTDNHIVHSHGVGHDVADDNEAQETTDTEDKDNSCADSQQEQDN